MKALHLGVIYGGRIIQERTVEPGQPVTIGESPHTTLTVPKSARVGPKAVLFQAAGPRYALVFGEKASGYVNVEDTEVELSTLRQRGIAKKSEHGFLLPLKPEARGTVELGDTLIVFDFVEKKPAPEPLKLPVDVRVGMIGGFDAVLATSLTVSSLVFGLLIMWISTIPVPEEITFDQIDDKFAQMIMPTKREPEKKDEKKPEAKKEEKKEKKEEEKKPEPEEKEQLATRKKEIQAKVANKGVLAILGTKGQGVGAVADVFGEGKTISSDIDAAFSGIGGVEVANGTNSTSRGAGGGGTSSSIGALATSGGGKVGLAERTEARVGNVKLTEAPEVDGSLDQADIARVVRGRITAVKECYERELKRDPKLSGKVVVRFTIDEEGRVTQTVIEENTLPDKTVATCVAQRIERFRFPKPDGGSVTVAYPFIFSPSS